LASEKILRFQNKNKDIAQVAQQIEMQLKTEGYKTRSTVAPVGNVIKAKKVGIVRDVVAADRAFTIVVSGKPNDFSVHIEIGKWILNGSIAPSIGSIQMLNTSRVEKGLAKEIQQIVG
jgi:hypothetical protein